MCNKIKAYEREGISFLLTLPIKHKNRIRIVLLQYLKITNHQRLGKEHFTYEKH